MGSDKGHLPLFETRKGRGRVAYRVFSSSMFVGICLIWAYRVSHLVREGELSGEEGGGSGGRWRWGWRWRWWWWVWLGMLASELWFGLYWILTQAPRWNLVFRRTFRDRLSHRYESQLPGVDVFVCTADPAIEPPIMVINTVLSVMAYNYPAEKLAVYLSDDAGSNISYYALLEASEFARHWIPFCQKFKVEPRSPEVYFGLTLSGEVVDDGHVDAESLSAIKMLYRDMKKRIETAHELGRPPETVLAKHKEFSQWDSYTSRRDHDTILEIVIDRRDPKAVDIEANVLPTLVYMAREKRPQYHHNFKAGAMNALLRVSSAISNGQVVLNVDCDMYSNYSEAIRDALCFFLDEEKGHEFAYVQFPQLFENVTKNELYSGSLRVPSNVELHGMDGHGGVLYIGSGCFHRRDSLCGKRLRRGVRDPLSKNSCVPEEKSINEIKKLASCAHEKKTQWGGEVGLKYGCAVEDVITGLCIKYRGWKSVYCNPERKAFLGVSPITLLQTLVQHKRWSEGHFQIVFSPYSTARHRVGGISPALSMSYLIYGLWAPNCFATLYYSIVPSLCLLKGVSLFPQVSSPWFIPFGYVIFAKYTYSLAEFLWTGGTILGWWNDQRMWLYKRTSSYLFGTVDALAKLLGFSETGFVITSKVAEDDVSQRYENETMEFGATSPMLTILTTLALLNLVCFQGAVAAVIGGSEHFGSMLLQVILCGVLIAINIPLYHGIIRKDKGKMPVSTAARSIVFALFACTCFVYL